MSRARLASLTVALAAATAGCEVTTHPPAGDYVRVQTLGGGVITGDVKDHTGEQLSCGADCDGFFTGPVLLEAHPHPGTQFLGWAGACSGTGDCIVDPSFSKSEAYVVAEFGPPAISWIAGATGAGRDHGHAVAAVDDESVVFAGSYELTLAFDGIDLPYGPGAFVIRAGRSGVIWTAAFASQLVHITGLAVEGDAVVLLLHSYGPLLVGAQIVGSETEHVSALVALDLQTGQLRRVTSFGGSAGNVRANDFAVVGGEFVVVGSFDGTAFPGAVELTALGGHDGFVLGIGDDGAPTWSARIGTAEDDHVDAVAVAADGRLALGAFAGGEPLSLPGATQPGVVVGFLDPSSLTSEWTSLGGTYPRNADSLSPLAKIVALDAERVLAVGRFGGVLEADGLRLEAPRDGMEFLAAVDASGHVGLLRGVVGQGPSMHIAAVCRWSEGVILGGTIQIPAQFGADLYRPRGVTDGVVVALDDSLDVVWSRRIGGEMTDSIHSVACTANALYAAGSTGHLVVPAGAVQVGGHQAPWFMELGW